MKSLVIYSLILISNIAQANQLDSKYRNQAGGIGSHITPLLTAIAWTDGPILELGCGDFSTPQLHAICSKSKRYIRSCDTSKTWLEKFAHLKCNWHEFQYVPVYADDWEKDPKPQIWDTVGNDRHWSVVLVDHRPGERRAVDINRLRKNADIIVVHDTETGKGVQADYKYEPVFATFKYRIDYDPYHPRTTIVSDTVDVAQLFAE